MADSNASAANATEIDPIAARMFARRFPGVALTRLGTYTQTTRTCESVWLCFEGPGDLLVEFGLLEPCMVPPKSKRRIIEIFPQGDCEEHVWVKRKAKGRIYARRELTQLLPADHVLAFLAPYNHPYADTFEEKRDLFMAEFESSARFLLGYVGGASRGLLDVGVHGLRLDDTSQARISGVLSAFDTDLRLAIAAARVQTPKRARSLRLVVDNTRNEVPHG